MIELQNVKHDDAVMEDFDLAVLSFDQGLMSHETLIEMARNAVVAMGEYAFVYTDNRFNEIVDLLDVNMRIILPSPTQAFLLVSEALRISIKVEWLPKEVRDEIQKQIKARIIC